MITDTVLCIDIGNSRLKWGYCRLANLGIDKRGSIDLERLCVNQLNACFSGMEAQPVWISCVAASEYVELIERWFDDNWGMAVNQIALSLKAYKNLNAYMNTGDLGVDRWLAMVAMQNATDNDFCIIDAGTAITIDVVVDGSHKGGLIMPGLQLMLDSLQGNTENLENESGQNVSLAINTADAVASGVVDGVVGGIERAILRIKKMYPDIVVTITGGDAERIAMLSRIELVIENNTVLKGVGVMARDAYA